MVNGHPYTKSLAVSNEQDALAELALFDRDPAAYQTKTAEKSRPPSQVITIEGPGVGRFLEFLRTEERTERYRRNVQHYLATWGTFYAGRDIRSVPLQEISSTRVAACTIRAFDAQALAAAQRLRARGSAPVDSFIRKVVKRAVEKVNKHAHREVLKPIRFGELRHSFVTWAHERGQEVRPEGGWGPSSYGRSRGRPHDSAHNQVLLRRREDAGDDQDPAEAVPSRGSGRHCCVKHGAPTFTAGARSTIQPRCECPRVRMAQFDPSAP